MKLFISLFAMAALGLSIPACGKKAEPTKATEPAPEADAAPTAEADAAPTMADDAAPTMADDAAAMGEVKPYLKVTVAHNDTTKPIVEAQFNTFTVVEAHTDLSNLETAKAVIDVDLTSFSSGIADRDKHVLSADFLDAATNPKATVTVDRIKAGTAADMYDATATIDLRGVKKEVPVSFKVVEKKADGTMVIEGETKGLNRADWNMTKTPAEVNVAPTFDVALRIELKETGAPVKAAEGTPAELFAKMTAHQEAVLTLIETNKADAEKAAEAVEKYAAEHKDELMSLAAAMKNVPPDQIEATLKASEEKVKALTERGTKLMTESPDLMKNERFVKAMASLSGN